MSRILAGQAKGRRLRSPLGHDTRPTASRVRQALFDVLAGATPGCRFLDAFAGSGAIGIEALSRGAARVVFLERDPRALASLRKNLEGLPPGLGLAQVFRQDARVAVPALADRGERFDLVYLDPPYASDLYEPLLGLLAGSGILAEGALVIAEHFHKRPLPETIGGLARVRELRVGDHRLSFFREAGRGGGAG